MVEEGAAVETISLALYNVSTFLKVSHLWLQQIIQIIYMYCYDYTHNIIAHESAVNKHSIMGWSNFIREICEEYLELIITGR